MEIRSVYVLVNGFFTKENKGKQSILFLAANICLLSVSGPQFFTVCHMLRMMFLTSATFAYIKSCVGQVAVVRSNGFCYDNVKTLAHNLDTGRVLICNDLNNDSKWSMHEYV